LCGCQILTSHRDIVKVLQNTVLSIFKEHPMARAKTFSLGDAYDGILADLVKHGRFGTETEAVRAGIRMLADYEMRVQSLRQAIQSAESQIAEGLGIEYDTHESLLADVMNDDEGR
jgi:antitoxin ParD1/3/4